MIAKRRSRQYFLEHEIADRYALRMRRLFLTAIASSSQRLRGLAAQWAKGPAHIFDAIPWRLIELDWLQGFSTALLDTLWAAASAQTRALSVEKQREPIGTLGFSLDKTNPRALRWAEEHAAELVVDLSESSKQAVRQLIVDMYAQGISPDEAVRRLRQHLGLDARSSQALENFRQRFERENAQRTVDRKPLIPRERISDQVDRYAARLLRHRAELIVRTESIRASAQGQQELWNQATEQGFLRPAETRRAWILTPDERLCPICEPMASNDKLVGLDQPFVLGDGSLHLTPPAHPQCRCATGLVFANERGEFVHPQA